MYPNQTHAAPRTLRARLLAMLALTIGARRVINGRQYLVRRHDRQSTHIDKCADEPQPLDVTIR